MTDGSTLYMSTYGKLDNTIVISCEMTILTTAHVSSHYVLVLLEVIGKALLFSHSYSALSISIYVFPKLP